MDARRRVAFDPLQVSFSAGQELYKGGLLSVVNLRRAARSLPPVDWPAVGATPRDTVWSEGAARLHRYRPPAGARPGAGAPKTPLLLVCSLINRPYVLDLLPGRSVVGRLLDAGHDVWLLDWGTPSPDDAARGLADYALHLLPAAARAVRDEAGTSELHLLGYCMGGTLALAAIAAGALPARSLVALATPVDLHDEGLLSTWCRAPGLDPEELARAYGNVPPWLLQPAFKMLDPVGLATKLLHLDDKIGDDDFLAFFLAMETWLEDSVAFPGRAFADWVSAYRTNALVRGALRLDGRAIDLGRVRCPILNVVAEGDYITPPASSEALSAHAGSRDQTLVRRPGGHIGLSTSGAAHRELWPLVAAWLDERGAVRRGATAPKPPRGAARRGAGAPKPERGAPKASPAARRARRGGR